MKNYNIIIEIPKNSSIKYEFDHKTNSLIVDRFLFGTNIYPGNYGFIPETLEFDFDPIDVLVICSKSVQAGSQMSVKIIGALNMIDDGDRDIKLLAVFVKDPEYKHIKSYKEVNKYTLNKIVDFFKNYKNLENKITEIGDWIDHEESCEIVEKALKRFEKNKKLIHSNKKEELKKILNLELNKK